MIRLWPSDTPRILDPPHCRDPTHAALNSPLITQPRHIACISKHCAPSVLQDETASSCHLHCNSSKIAEVLLEFTLGHTHTQTHPHTDWHTNTMNTHAYRHTHNFLMAYAGPWTKEQAINYPSLCRELPNQSTNRLIILLLQLPSDVRTAGWIRHPRVNWEMIRSAFSKCTVLIEATDRLYLFMFV